MSNEAQFDTTFAAVAFGSISPNSEFKADSRLAKGLPGNLPVLSGILDVPDFETLTRAYGRGDSPVCLGFGNMQACSASGQMLSIMTIRLQLGGVQLYWLADMSDAEVWRAVDAWRKRKQLPISVGHSKQMLYMVPDYAVGRMVLDSFRGEIRAEASPEFLDVVCGLASSGIVEAQATTDIPGVELQRVLVNVLMSPRLRKFVNGRVMREKPIVVNQATTSLH